MATTHLKPGTTQLEKENTRESFLEKRISPFRTLLDDIVEFEITDYNTKEKVKRTLLSSDEHDNINIHYHGLHGSPWVYHEKGVKQSKKYIRKRLKNPMGNIKYLSPKEAGLLPFFPPAIIKKYQERESIKTLFLIEGEFKAIVASLNNIDCVGLGSIHGFYAPKNNDRPYYKGLQEEIVALITTCQVQNLVYLTDADTLTINYDSEKDLAKRPKSFYSAVNNFRDAAKRLVYSKDCPLKAFYYCHIRDFYNPDSKGIDDLFQNHQADKEAIAADLLRLDKSDRYFKCLDLLANQASHLKKYFGLENEENFYEVYKDFLGTREFIFEDVKYYHDSENLRVIENLQFTAYRRVGTTYFKEIEKTRLIEGVEIKTAELSIWTKGEIQTDFGSGCLKFIRKYDDFTNMPNWIDHKQEIDRCYNLCKELPYKPKPGSFANTVLFMQHIANDSDFIKLESNEIKEVPVEGNIGTMLLDYLSIMVQKPTHDLPIPCLLSREQETGKTTFAQLITTMFDGNSTIIQTKDFGSDFNSHWAGKFFVCIDEGYFEDKREAKEKIKQLSTSEKITLNTKGVAQKQIDNYSKFLICSNDEENFITLERTDKRFWIIKIKTIEKKDPDLKRKIFEEIPCFFHFLMNREIFHKRTNRLWFDERLVQNEEFNKMVKSSKLHWQQEIDEAIVHLMEQTSYEEYHITVSDLLNFVKAFNRNCRVTNVQIKRYLQKDLQMTPLDQMKHRSFEINPVSHLVEEYSDKKNGRPYLFLRAEWCAAVVKKTVEEADDQLPF